MNDEITKLTQKLAAQLSQNDLKICTAESCTGGLIAKTFTDLAGSSTWFDRGFVTYSNQAKVDMLGVQVQTLQAFGAVSQQVVEEMVAGAITHSQADVAIAVTGIAGPGGGSDDKPVGTVWFGFYAANQPLSEKKIFAGDRLQVRESSLLHAIKRIHEIIVADNI